jgi:hypothetical protein
LSVGDFHFFFKWEIKSRIPALLSSFRRQSRGSQERRSGTLRFSTVGPNGGDPRGYEIKAWGVGCFELMGLSGSKFGGRCVRV